MTVAQTYVCLANACAVLLPRATIPFLVQGR